MNDRHLARLAAVLVLLAAAGAAQAAGFAFQDIQGRKHTLAGYRGKWVLVNFWATWCPPCRQEIPDLIALHDKHKDKDLVVLGVAMDYRSGQEVKDFAVRMALSYPVILGTDETAAQVGDSSSLPTTYLYNPHGKMVAYNVGAVTRQAIESYIAAKGGK